MRSVQVVGFGPGAQGYLTLAAHEALCAADVVVGAARVLDALPQGVRGRRVPAVLGRDMVAALQADGAWQRAALVMTGDIGFFSGAKRALAELAGTGWSVECIPGIGSAQLFAARLGRAWQDWRFASAHGVDCDVERLACGGQPLFLVTDAANSPAALCERLKRCGLGAAQVSVGERLSYPDERITCGTADELAGRQFAPLAVMLVEAEGALAARQSWPWATQGIPDELFCRGKVPMTKQEVRAVALAKLRIAPADVVYDVGAGTGSVSVEAALLARAGQVYAIERNEGAVELIARNAAAFGCGNLHVVAGLAPAALAGLPAPQAAYIGGSARQLEGILDDLLEKNPQVRVCVACVTLETLAQATELLGAQRFEAAEMVCVNVARAEELGSYHLMRAQNPVYLVSARGRAVR